MGWVKDALKELSAGRSVQIRPFGGSMSGRVESGQIVTLSPVAPEALEVGDIVLVQWKGSYLLHLVKEIGGEGFLIANNLGKTNGWVSAEAIRGKVVAVGSEPVEVRSAAEIHNHEAETMASQPCGDSSAAGIGISSRPGDGGRPLGVK